MKQLYISSVLGAAVYAALSGVQVQAHGWVEFPSARQNICFLDGGFWDNTIPNAACQNAYDQSGAYPFVQRNEVSANVASYNDMDAVKAVVVDGQLCSAADPAKSGLNIPSPDWQKTAITLDENQQIELVFNATAVHNPSYWQFYLTTPNYDGFTPLTWNDLEQIGEAQNVEAGSDKKYRIKVTLPSQRTGDAVLLTRWQRVDPAGEGFYNCSDITFSADGDSSIPTVPTEPPVESQELTALGQFVETGFGPAEVGDTVRFRSFDRDGNEIRDLTMMISNTNLNTWGPELAAQFNQDNEGWFIGIWSESMQHYMFDSENLYANQVHAPDALFSYQLSLIKQDQPPTQVDNLWQADVIYDVGDVVIHDGQSWTAQWWTRGEEPGTTGQWGVWR